MAAPPSAGDTVTDVPDGRGGVKPEMTLRELARVVRQEHWELDVSSTDAARQKFKDFTEPAQREAGIRSILQDRANFREYASKLPQAEYKLWHDALQKYDAQKGRILSSANHSEAEKERVARRIHRLVSRVTDWNTAVQGKLLDTARSQRDTVEASTTGWLLSCNRPSFFDSKAMLVLLLVLNVAYLLFLCVALAFRI